MECCLCFPPPTPPPPQIADLNRLQYPNRRHQLESIERSAEHRLTLLDWNAQMAACRANLNRKLHILNSSTSHLYQILGFFFVFEGVIITTLTQATAFNCYNAWIIYILFGMATCATVLACVQKLGEIMEVKRKYLEERAVSSALNGSIERLKEEGDGFDLIEGGPKFGRGFPVRISGFWRRWLQSSYAVAVFIVLLSFSGFTLIAVRLILCDSRRKS